MKHINDNGLRDIKVIAMTYLPGQHKVLSVTLRNSDGVETTVRLPTKSQPAADVLADAQ